MKKICLLLVMLLFITGCVKNYSNKDINNYIKNTIGISGYQLGDSRKVVDDDEYEDTYWDVKYKDIKFVVYDDRSWKGEGLSSYLRTTFDDVVINTYYNKYSKKDTLLYTQDYVYHKNHLTCNVADDNKIVDEVKLKECYDNIYDFISTINLNDYPLSSVLVAITNSTSHVRWTYIINNKKILTYNEFKK